MIKFVGTDKNNETLPMIYIIVFISTILFILLFAAITVFCFGLKKMYVARSQHSEASAQRDSVRGNNASASRPVIEQDPLPARIEPTNEGDENADGRTRRFKGLRRNKKD
jgi:hypothetical protein